MQPHFNDERTVLSARPVVPLEKIDTRVKHRRVWFLGGAFAAAMLLGAASALLSAYFKFRNAPEPQIQSLSVSESVLPLPSVEIVPQRPKVRPKGNTDRTDKTIIVPHIDRRLNEDEALRRIRDAVLVDEWQERRQRRVERREERRERRRAERSGRDLSHLNEIFEGPRRRY
ncbi:MAG TPA: hypothetical protein VFP64_01645 [Pyrinomonadaceae bacterium]|nr:hypothetical protein [Pyrinomonadaceae bacterium]